MLCKIEEGSSRCQQTGWMLRRGFRMELGQCAALSSRFFDMSSDLSEDPYDLDALNVVLDGTPFAGRVRYFRSVGSTNRFAMKEAEDGAPAGSVYLADEQTEGRGRGLHRWHSSPGDGLYISVLLRPHFAPADALWISLAGGLAVRQAILDTTSIEADIRWPNDLLVGNRKLCGILTELHAEATRVRHLVIGIGINVHQQQFPADVAAAATSLRVETGKRWPRQELLQVLLQSLHREAAALDRDPSSAVHNLLDRLEHASTWIRGKRVKVEEAEGYSGVTAGLDPRGFLQVRTPMGIRTVLSGGVREA